MAKDTQVRVAASTKAALNRAAARVQLNTGVNVPIDLVIRVALEKAFPDDAKKEGIDTEKEIEERKK